MRRRTTQVFSLAFLDCICCGFGAIILIFVLSLAGEDRLSQAQIDQLMRLMEALNRKLALMSTSREDLDRDNARVASLLADARMKNDSLHSLIDDLEQKLAYEKNGQEALLVDLDALQKEIAARQKKNDMPIPQQQPLPVGVPVGSNYIAFVVDTSGSMRDPITDRIHNIVLRKFDEVLDIYPTVKGIQIVDSNGQFILREGQGWLPDTPETRARMKRAVRAAGDAYSNPVPGILAVFSRLYREDDPDMKLGIYVFGDEFQGVSAPVISRIDRANPPDAEGKRRVVINAIGFPTVISQDAYLGADSTQLKFANLMRELCYIHGGAFIALEDI